MFRTYSKNNKKDILEWKVLNGPTNLKITCREVDIGLLDECLGSLNWNIHVKMSLKSLNLKRKDGRGKLAFSLRTTVKSLKIEKQIKLLIPKKSDKRNFKYFLAQKCEVS